MLRAHVVLGISLLFGFGFMFAQTLQVFFSKECLPLLQVPLLIVYGTAALLGGWLLAGRRMRG